MKQRCYMGSCIMPIVACSAVFWTSWSFWVVPRALSFRIIHSVTIKAWVIVCRPSQSRMVYQKKVCKGLPGYNCHLLLKQQLKVQKDPKLCINLKCRSATSFRTEDGKSLVSDGLNKHSHFILSTLSPSVLLLLIQIPHILQELGQALDSFSSKLRDTPGYHQHADNIWPPTLHMTSPTQSSHVDIKQEELYGTWHIRSFGLNLSLSANWNQTQKKKEN